MIIRNARPDELDAVAALLKDAYWEYESVMGKGTFKYYVAELVDVRSRMADSDLIVAEHDGQLAGAVTFYSDASKHLEGNWPEAVSAVRYLAVHPSKRGLGIARALMEECLRRSRALGLKALGLHTTDFMADARRMYERMGFVRVPQHDFQPVPHIHVMGYRLDLGPNDQ